MKNKQSTTDKVKIVRDMIDMNNDGKISDDIPKILAFLTTIKVTLSKMFKTKK